MAFYATRVLAGQFVTVPPGVTKLERAYSYIDFTTGNYWAVGRGPGIATAGQADPSALVVVDNPGNTVANGGSTQPVSAEIGAPVLLGQKIYVTGDGPSFLIFS